MLGNSTWSRALEYKLGRISEQGAIDYLIKENFNQELAKRVVGELVGDSLSLLVAISKRPERTIEGII